MCSFRKFQYSKVGRWNAVHRLFRVLTLWIAIPDYCICIVKWSQRAAWQNQPIQLQIQFNSQVFAWRTQTIHIRTFLGCRPPRKGQYWSWLLGRMGSLMRNTTIWSWLEKLGGVRDWESRKHLLVDLGDFQVTACPQKPFSPPEVSSSCACWDSVGRWPRVNDQPGTFGTSPHQKLGGYFWFIPNVDTHKPYCLGINCALPSYVLLHF